MTIRVLVAEDNQALRESLGVLLPCRNIEPTLCADAAEFLQIAQDSLHSFDAMIIDVSLPDMSGWELLSQVRQAGHPQPVLVCSGSPAPRSLPSDCHFMMKPFPPHNLIESLQRLVPRQPESFGVTKR